MSIAPNKPPKHERFVISEEEQEKLDVSFEECKDLTERELKCPHCNYVIGGLFGKAQLAHIRLSCHKCGSWMILNIAHYRRKSNTPWQGFYRRKNVR